VWAWGATAAAAGAAGGWSGGGGGFSIWRARGDEFTGFQRREAGWRGGPWYSERRLRLKMRFVSDQRTGGSGDAGAGV